MNVRNSCISGTPDVCVFSFLLLVLVPHSAVLGAYYWLSEVILGGLLCCDSHHRPSRDKEIPPSTSANSFSLSLFGFLAQHVYSDSQALFPG